MKKTLFLLILLLPYFTFAQSKTIYETKYKKHSRYFVEIENNTAYVIAYHTIPRIGGHDSADHSIAYIDTLKTQYQDNILIGNKSKIQYIKDAKYLIITPNKKVKKYRLRPIDMAPKDYRQFINQGVWWKKFGEMGKELGELFSVPNYGYLHGRRIWSQIAQKDADYQDFVVIADQKIATFRDSILAKEETLVELNKNYPIIIKQIESNITTIPYADLRDLFLQLPMDPNNSYFIQAMNVIGENKPEFFYQLLDNLPLEYHTVYSSLNRSAARKVIKTKTDSPIRKEFKKYHRRKVLCNSAGTLRGVAILTAVAAEAAGIVYGIVWLIRR